MDDIHISRDGGMDEGRIAEEMAGMEGVQPESQPSTVLTELPQSILDTIRAQPLNNLSKAA